MFTFIIRIGIKDRIRIKVRISCYGAQDVLSFQNKIAYSALFCIMKKNTQKTANVFVPNVQLYATTLRNFTSNWLTDWQQLEK